jgi:hypothetical protein
MALNFGLLDQGGPTNFFEGYSQGQEKMQANAMAQQRAAQAQQEFGMRQQEFAAGQAEKKRLSTAAIVTQRTASAREAILNARTPDDARAIERAQHADEYLGPIRRQFGSLQADLADIPDEPTAFNQWKLKQALGAAKFIERMDADAQFAAAMGGAPARAAPAPTPMAAAVSAPAAAAPMLPPSAPKIYKVGDTYPYTYTDPIDRKYGESETRTVTQADLDQLKNYRGPQVQLPSDLTAMPAPVANAMVPQAPAPVANAMAPAPAPAPAAAPPQTQLQSLVDQYERFSRKPNPDKRDENRIKFLTEEIARASKRNLYTVAGVGLVDADTNKIVYASQEKGNALAELQANLAAATDPKVRKEIQARIDKEISHPLPTRVETKVNAYVPASEAAQTQFMQEARVTFSALKNAQPTLDNIEAAKALVPTAKGFMGTGGEPLLAAASFLNNRLGTKIDTKGVVDATELRSRLFFGILDNLKKLDSQPSQSQQAAMQEALGNLGTDPNALGRVLDAFGDSIRSKVDSHNIEMSDAETRGVKFPYNPRIVIKPKSGAASNPHAGKTNEQIKKELGL